MRSRPLGRGRAGGTLASAQAARAEIDVDVDEDVRALPGAASADRELVHARDAALRAPLLPRGARVRGTRRARRRARLPPHHPLPELASRAGASTSRSLDHTDDANGLASSVPYNFITPTARRPRRWTSSTTSTTTSSCCITHEFTHVVHLDTILGCVPAPGRHAARQDLRAQPVAAELVHRRARGADGVAPDDRGPPAQQLLRHAPARAVPRGPRARPRRGLGRLRPARLSGRQRPPTSTARAFSGTSRIATAPRRSARSPTATRTNASPAASTGSRRRRSAAPTRARSATTSGTTGRARRRTATRCRRKKPSGAA